MGSILNPADLLKLPTWAQQDIAGLVAQNQHLRGQLSLNPDGADTVIRLPANPRRGIERALLGNGLTVEFGGAFGASYQAGTHSLSVWRLPVASQSLPHGLVVVPFTHRELTIREEPMQP